MVFIDYSGISALTELEKELIKKLILSYGEKLDTKLPPNTRIAINIKLYEKTGERKKYSIHARLNVPDQVLVAEAADWDLEKTTHKVMKKIEAELNHVFKDLDRGFKKEYE